MTVKRRTIVGGLIGSGLLAACGGGDAPERALAEADDTAGATERPLELAAAANEAVDLGASPPRVVTLYQGLENPWGLAFLPDGSMLVTERPGRLRRLSVDGSVLSDPIEGLPEIYVKGEGGLLDVAIDPEFGPTKRWVYLTFAEPGFVGATATMAGTAVFRAWLTRDHKRLTEGRVIFRAEPKVYGSSHFGSRLAFRSDGSLFVTLGDRGQRDLAQDLGSHLGKIVRIWRNGDVPKANPFAKVRGARPEIFSVGHRNVQGAAFHPATDALYISEHGPQGGDEINLVRIGRNYGWPRISYGCEYGTDVATCEVIGGATEAPGLEQPLAYWSPKGTAPSGIAFYTGDKFPEWQGSLLVSSLGGKVFWGGASLWRLTIRWNRVVAREVLLPELNDRIRNVRQGPDGWIYLLTDRPDGRVLRVER
jgi:glucose/arabinose dehydrogenase